MDAFEAATGVGSPLIAKVVSPQVIHKSDVGGVVVGVKNEQGLREAYRRLEPVFCGPDRCVVADARIMLPRSQG